MEGGDVEKTERGPSMDPEAIGPLLLDIRAAGPTEEEGPDMSDKESVLEPVVTDWAWLDAIEGKFSKNFFAEGRTQPAHQVEVLPEPPSRTAIQHVLTTVGQCAEDGAQQLELALQGAAPLDAEGDTLVVSWDGVTVPLREPAPKRGRPAERPMATATDPAPTAWKEAGVGMVATYLTPLDPVVGQFADPLPWIHRSKSRNESMCAMPRVCRKRR